MSHFIAVEPLETHWRPAHCKEVACPHYLHGWQTIVPNIGPQADYIRRQSGREFRESREGELAVFTFPPGQHCFRTHRIKLGKGTILIKETNGVKELMEAEAWQEAWNKEAETYNRKQKEGG